MGKIKKNNLLDAIYELLSDKCSIDEAENIAKKIIENTPNYNNTTTPIVKIAGLLNIKAFVTDSMEALYSGVVFAGSKVEDKTSYKGVVFLDKNEPLSHQRFVLAHELGHYLFDYLGKKDKKSDLFCMYYYKNNEGHDKNYEKRADRFAAELLMPKKLFIYQYNKIMEEEENQLFAEYYLAEFFNTKISSIRKRMIEVFG